MSTVYVKLGPGQNGFEYQEQQGGYSVEYPLGERDRTHHIISARFMCQQVYYVPLAANSPLTSPFTGATAYLIGDFDFQEDRGGILTWTRRWATVPATWEEPGGTFAFTFPAYTAGVAFGSIFAPTAIAANGNYYTINTNATGITTGESVLLDLAYVRANQNYHVTFVTDAKFANSGTDLTIAKVLPGQNVFSSVSGQLREWSTGRTLPETIEVDSVLIHEYALADDTSVDVLLPQVDRFSPVNSSGYEVDTLSTGLATFPNSTTYASMVAAGSRIPARRSDRRIYMGNIYERATVVVAAR